MLRLILITYRIIGNALLKDSSRTLLPIDLSQVQLRLGNISGPFDL